MTERILIWGAGAIGGTFGAILASTGVEVTFVDIAPEHVAKIRDPNAGLKITGPIKDMTISVPAFTPDELGGQWSRIFLAVKAQDTKQAAKDLAPHLTDDGFVVSFQNGLCEDEIASVVGPRRTMGAFINFGADWIQPGEVHFGNRAAVVVGETDGSITDRAKDLHELVKKFEPDAILTDDIASYLWGKLAYGTLLIAQGVCESGIADTLERGELFPLWRTLAGEVIDIARASGVSPRGFNGFDPDAFGTNGSEPAARASVQAMVDFNRPNAKTHSGIWRDLAVRKRPTEVDSMLGKVVQLGQARGIASPATEKLVAMIHEVEQGKRSNSDRNLEELLAS